jgi:prepilin-type N-terminal cleavage/methylation domain-containing protein
MIAAKPLRQKGFTIIELMIATAVFSTILLMVTVLMINIGNLYYKGVNQARVQDNVRSISDEVSQQLKLGDSFTPSDPTKKGANGEQAYCIGSKRYTYVVGIQISTPQPPAASGTSYRHVLWRDDNPSPGSCSVIDDSITPANEAVNLTTQSPSTGLHGAELIAPRSRLIHFSLIGTSPYSVAVGVAYGDNDLLCNPSVVGSCASNVAMPNFGDYTSGNLLCKGNLGRQFCATAKLNTSVVKRLP